MHMWEILIRVHCFVVITVWPLRRGKDGAFIFDASLLKNVTCGVCTLDCSGHCARLRQLADETKICRVKCPTFRFVFSKEAFERLCPPISRHLAVLTPGPLIMASFHICIGFLSCPHFHKFAHYWRRGQVWCPFLADFYLNLMEAAIWNFSISCHLSKMRVLCNI